MDGSFEHPKQMFKLMDMKIFNILLSEICFFILAYYYINVLISARNAMRHSQSIADYRLRKQHVGR